MCQQIVMEEMRSLYLEGHMLSQYLLHVVTHTLPLSEYDPTEDLSASDNKMLGLDGNQENQKHLKYIKIV